MSSAGYLPPFHLGIDLGGTNIKSGVVDDTGKPLSAVSLPTETEQGPQIGTDNLAIAARKAVESSGLAWDQIQSIGLGSPGTLDLPAGMLIHPVNFPNWSNFPIRDELATRLNRSVAFQNDANAAAYGEFWAGAGRGAHTVVLLTLGTGIGCGVVNEGQIIEGRHSHGAECGHIIIQMENGRLCSCGQHGHLEAYASATSLVKRAHEALEGGAVSSLGEHLAEGPLTSRIIDLAAEAGDPLAVKLMEETAHYLAVGAVNLMHSFDPDMVLFGGGMIAAGPNFLNMIREGIQKLAFPICAARTRVEYAELGGDAGFIGAAGYARMKFKTP